MKNTLWFLLAIVLLGLVVSCGPGVPAKELISAKSALESARLAEAGVFAPNELMAAENDYNEANSFVTNNKNKEAKEKADSSKVKAEQALALTKENKAKDISEKCRVLLEGAELNFAARLYPAEHTEATNLYNAVRMSLEAKDYDSTYATGTNLKPKLDILFSNSLQQVTEARNALSQAQDQYTAAENRDIVKQYALEDLKIALPFLDAGGQNLSAGELEPTKSNAKSASDAVAKAVAKAESEYQKSLSQTGDKDTLNLDKQKEVELQKKKAIDAIQQARERLKKLQEKKEGKKTSLIMIYEFPLIQRSYTAVTGAGDTNNAALPSSSSVTNTETVSEETVNKYIELADQAFAAEEYLDAIDYAREAIRIADILLADTDGTIYVVKLNPENRDCLWKIAGYVYKNQTWLWPVIWRANKFQIQDPDLIYPGQELKIPPAINE